IDVVYSNVLLKLIGGESSSLGTRFDQANALMIGLAESYYDILFGQGLGSKLNIITAVRDYRKFIYYELQSLYILYQIGFLGFLSLIVL
ncbi:TPA: polymerase, partial [Proteus mirabilis]|nr:polymerase [Proteus mirabilis]